MPDHTRTRAGVTSALALLTLLAAAASPVAARMHDIRRLPTPGATSGVEPIGVGSAAGGSETAAQRTGGAGPAGGQNSQGVSPPTGYTIGPEDVLDVIVLGEKDMTVQGAVVRPDGMISVPLLNDIKAQGLTVDELRAAITKAASTLLKTPTVDVVVRQINSRRVSITGAIAKPGQYPLLSRMTVVDLISAAGGLTDWAKKNNIRVSRVVNGKRVSLRFNYDDFMDGKPAALEQNVELLPDDIVTVPD